MLFSHVHGVSYLGQVGSTNPVQTENTDPCWDKQLQEVKAEQNLACNLLCFLYLKNYLPLWLKKAAWMQDVMHGMHWSSVQHHGASKAVYQLMLSETNGSSKYPKNILMNLFQWIILNQSPSNSIWVNALFMCLLSDKKKDVRIKLWKKSSLSKCFFYMLQILKSLLLCKIK